MSTRNRIVTSWSFCAAAASPWQRGYRNLFQRDSEEGITAGGGFYTNLLGNVTIGIDYAYAHFGRLENAQRFSVCMQF